MRKIIFQILLLFLLQLFFPLYVKSSEGWELLFKPRQRTVKSIGIYDGLIFAGTKDGIYRSVDGGSSFQDFGSEALKKDFNGNSEINWIDIDKKNERIYIATSFGTYYSSVWESNWEEIFEGLKTEATDINSLTRVDNNLYLSTNDGLWICEINSNSCNRFNQGIEADLETGSPIPSYLLNTENGLILAASNGVYHFSQTNKIWEKKESGIKFLPDGSLEGKHLFNDNKGNIYLACGTGLYRSKDKDLNWENISNGIEGDNDGFLKVYYITQNEDSICAGAASGAYCFDEEHWINISFGIKTKQGNKNVYWLSFYNSNIYAATDEGLYIKKHSVQEPDSKVLLKGQVETDFAYLEKLEPSVVEVQKQALKFASLPTSGDYKRYRLLARIRNLVPRFVLDLNTTGTSTNFLQNEKGISTDIALDNSFDAEKISRFERDGRSFKQVSLLWNTNDFIYDDEINDLLNHARLTANIRENLLDDVTRIYYQRRKLQLDTLLSPPSNVSDNLNNKIKIAELTGQLDSRTGGWFTKEIKRRSKRNIN